MTVCVIVIAMVIATVLGVTAIRNIGNHDAEQTLLLLCETGQKDLNYYFQNVEGSVETVASKPIWIGSAMFFRSWCTTPMAS